MALVPNSNSRASNGFVGRGGMFYAVFHFDDGCFYRNWIVRNGNQELGRGRDERGRRRLPCSRCLRLRRMRLFHGRR